MKKDLVELAREWQHRLKLEDWHITIKPNTIPADIGCDKDGEVRYEESTKEATIFVLCEDCYPHGNQKKYDAEKILIHELLHLKFTLLDDSGCNIQDRLLHQLIEELAKSFVDAKRSGNGK